MILVDTSAWIEYLRDTGSPACHRVDQLISSETPMATCDTVVMELLAGSSGEREAATLLRLLDRCQFFPARPLFDSTGASDIYRACRRSGFTPRSVNDCLIAAVAVANGLEILHQDRDFDRISDVFGSFGIA
jgi:predicted nucleic acid-binding protein